MNTRVKNLLRKLERWLFDMSVNPKEWDPYLRGYSLKTGKPLPIKPPWHRTLNDDDLAILNDDHSR